MRIAATRVRISSLRHAAQAQAVADVAQHGHVRPERVGLEHHRHAALFRRHVHHVATEQPDRALGRFLEARDGAQQGGLSAAGGAQNGDELAGRDLEVHSVQHALVAIADVKAIDVDGRGYRCSHVRQTSRHAFLRSYIASKPQSGFAGKGVVKTAYDACMTGMRRWREGCVP